jgi:hypothetical protein
MGRALRRVAVDTIDGGSLNDYDYADQDPINKYDLDGMFPVLGGDAGGGGLGGALLRLTRAPGRGLGRPPVNGAWRKVVEPPMSGTSPARVSYSPGVAQRLRDDTANGAPRSSSAHYVSDQSVRQAISSGSRNYKNPDTGYVEYTMPSMKNGRWGNIEVGGYWYRDDRFFVTHRLFR